MSRTNSSGYPDREMNRLFVDYVEPLSKGQSLTPDEWETIINRVPGLEDRPKLKVKLVDYIINKKKNVVIMPAAILKSMHILEHKEKEIKKEVKELREEKEPVPDLFSIQKHNIAQAKRYAKHLGINVTKKIARYTKPIKIFRKKKVLKFVIEGDTFTQPDFEAITEKSRIELKRTGELKTVLANLRKLRALKKKGVRTRTIARKRLGR